MRRRLHVLPGMALLALLGCATGAGAQANSDAALLYVTNQNDATVSVIDTRTNEVVRTVDLTRLGFTANAKPHHVAVEPDGSFYYVTMIGDNRIVKFDRNDRVVAQATFETPGMLSLHPTEDLLFVGRSMSAVNPPQRIGVVDRSDMSIEEVSVLFPRPHAMALNTADGIVYTASLAVNQIAAVDFEAEDVEITEVAGPQHSLMQWAISPDGNTLVISGELSHSLLIFDIGSDPMKPRFVTSIDVGAQPFDPIFTLDGRWVYVGNKAANTITVIDMQTRAVAKVITGNGISQPHGATVSPDGQWVYISNNNLKAQPPMAGHEGHAMPTVEGTGGPGTIVVIDTRTQEIAKVIEVGHNAAGIGVRTAR